MTEHPNTKHPNAEILDLLRRTRELLDGPQKNGGNYAKVIETHAFTASGIGVEDSDETAARWTVVGALAKLGMPRMAWTRAPIPGLRDTQNFDAAWNFLYGASILQGPYTVNGVNNRGWEQVRDLLDFAILLAEECVAVTPVAGMAAGAVPSLALRRRFELIAKTRGVEIPS